MKTIYAVVSGSYSDYTVHFACTSRTVAEKAMTRMRHGSYDTPSVEEMVLIEHPDDVVQRTMFCVETDVTGREMRRWTYEQWSYDKDIMPSAVWEHPQGVVHGRGVSPRSYNVALKIARDKLAEDKAKQAGIA